MAQKKLHGVTIECVTGNIVEMPEIDAIVNAANAELRTGGGVAGAIHRAAGPELEAECRPLAPIKPGEAVITGAHRLPNRHVIHCLGPVYGADTPSDTLLAACYRNALRRAEEQGVTSIAFPAISTGVFCYPMKAAAEIAMRTVAEEAQNLSSVKRIVFVLFDADALRIHEEALARVTSERRVGG